MLKGPEYGSTEVTVSASILDFKDVSVLHFAMCVVCEVRITVVAVMESLLPGLALPEAGEEEVTEVDALPYVAQHLDVLDPTRQPSKGQGSQAMEVWSRILMYLS